MYLGEPLELSLPLKKSISSLPLKSISIVNLKAIEYNMLKSTSGCSSIKSQYQCLASILRKEKYANCTKKCTPLVFKTMMELDSNTSFPICETADVNRCIARSMNRYLLE